MNAKDILHDAHQALLVALEGISDQDTENHPVIETRNLRDVVGHLAAYEHLLEEVIASQMLKTRAEETPHLDKFLEMTREEFNKFHYDEHKFRPYSEVLTDLNSSHEHLMKSFYLLTERMLTDTGTLHWYGKQYSLLDFIMNVIVEHMREHTAQITAFKHHLKELKDRPSKP
jgi:hypothetical protein